MSVRPVFGLSGTSAVDKPLCQTRCKAALLVRRIGSVSYRRLLVDWINGVNRYSHLIKTAR